MLPMSLAGCTKSPVLGMLRSCASNRGAAGREGDKRVENGDGTSSCEVLEIEPRELETRDDAA